jgi:hypothetical protein
LKSLQKLYLFEQKGGENYLDWTIYWANMLKRSIYKSNNDEW